VAEDLEFYCDECGCDLLRDAKWWCVNCGEGFCDKCIKKHEKDCEQYEFEEGGQ